MAEQFKKLSDFEHARLRTEMYLGSREEHTQGVVDFDGKTLALREHTWVPALYTGLREVLDNALDEIVGHGHGDTIKIDYDPAEFLFTVEDNGRGIPIDEKPELGKGPAASILLGEARAGRNFAERGEVAGVNGLGAAIVNFTSEWFQLDVWRSGKHFRQKWEEGRYGGKEIHKTPGPNISKGSATRRGTRIQFRPSAKVYPKMLLPLEFVRARVWDIAVANPNLRVYFNGDRLLLPNTKDPLKTLYFGERPVTMIETVVKGFNARFYVSPDFSDQDEISHSLVNNIPVFQGGSHMDAFRTLFYAAVIDCLSSQAKKEKLTLRREDISNGLLILNVTRMEEAKFDSQTKVRLISEVQPKVKEGFIESDVKALIRRNPEWVEKVLERCRQRMGAKELREINKAQNAMQRSKVASLADATGRDRTNCVLFLAEGKSAIDGMMNVRNPDIHGGMALRGKLLNVHDETPKAVVENKVLADIMTAVGLKVGIQPLRDTLRYGAVFIATDEDEDGKNITALLVNFFYKYWPDLFRDQERPFVYKFSTPFIIAQKGSTRKYIYSHDYVQFQTDLAKDKYKGWEIIRAKGLSRLTKDDWKHSLENPALVPIVDDGKLKESLDLIFNKGRADDRKKWLEHE